MQQDKNDIENKLRQLENQQLPDLSQMDSHWENMHAVLQPGSSTAGNRNKWLWLIAALVLIGTAIFFVNYNNEITKNAFALKQANKSSVVKANLKPTDSVITVTIPVYKSQKPAMVIKTIKNTNEQRDINKAEINLPVQLNPTDSTLIAVGPDAQRILNELLASLAKKAEEFSIDNRRDTTLFAAEGSSLFIPANSLGGSSRVKISLREFYKTSDIVMNKLTTTSNGEQLVTGGMVHISASVNDKPVNVLPGKTIKWYLPDTSKQMEQMQLFKGEEKKDNINWISTEQRFGGSRNVMEVRVLDLRNEPFKTKESRRGTIGFFALSDDSKLSRVQLKSVLKEKYGYNRVKVRRERRGSLSQKFIKRTWARYEGIGDSAWINKELADKYKLPSTQARISQGYSGLFGNGIISVLNRSSISPKVAKNIGVDSLSDNSVYEFKNVSIELEKKYSVNINSLGWINCDRFYNDRREKVDYYVNLQDSAINFYTMMVFNKFRSMMTGYIIGNNVQFANVPVGEPVKVISIGVDQKGEVVMAMKETKISKEIFSGLQFESTSASAIKSSLRKDDN